MSARTRRNPAQIAQQSDLLATPKGSLFRGSNTGTFYVRDGGVLRPLNVSATLLSGLTMGMALAKEGALELLKAGDNKAFVPTKAVLASFYTAASEALYSAATPAVAPTPTAAVAPTPAVSAAPQAPTPTGGDPNPPPLPYLQFLGRIMPNSAWAEGGGAKAIARRLVFDEKKTSGAQAGGIYRDPKTGRRYYVKWPSNPEQARSEVFASQLGRVLGVTTMDQRLAPMQGGPNKGNPLAVISPLRDGLESLGETGPAIRKRLLGMPEVAKRLAATFPFDIYVANYDVVGPKGDNLLIDSAMGSVYRIDLGGALQWTGFGQPKSPPFGPLVGADVNTMLIQPTSARVAAAFEEARKNPMLMLPMVNEIRRLENESHYFMALRKWSGMSADLDDILVDRAIDLYKVLTKFMSDAVPASAPAAAPAPKPAAPAPAVTAPVAAAAGTLPSTPTYLPPTTDWDALPVGTLLVRYYEGSTPDGLVRAGPDKWRYVGWSSGVVDVVGASAGVISSGLSAPDVAIVFGQNAQSIVPMLAASPYSTFSWPGWSFFRTHYPQGYAAARVLGPDKGKAAPATAGGAAAPSAKPGDILSTVAGSQLPVGTIGIYCKDIPSGSSPQVVFFPYERTSAGWTVRAPSGNSPGGSNPLSELPVSFDAAAFLVLRVGNLASNIGPAPSTVFTTLTEIPFSPLEKKLNGSVEKTAAHWFTHVYLPKLSEVLSKPGPKPMSFADDEDEGPMTPVGIGLMDLEHLQPFTVFAVVNPADPVGLDFMVFYRTGSPEGSFSAFRLVKEEGGLGSSFSLTEIENLVKDLGESGVYAKFYTFGVQPEISGMSNGKRVALISQLKAAVLPLSPPSSAKKASTPTVTAANATAIAIDYLGTIPPNGIFIALQPSNPENTYRVFYRTGMPEGMGEEFQSIALTNGTLLSVWSVNDIYSTFDYPNDRKFYYFGVFPGIDSMPAAERKPLVKQVVDAALALVAGGTTAATAAPTQPKAGMTLSADVLNEMLGNAVVGSFILVVSTGIEKKPYLGRAGTYPDWVRLGPYGFEDSTEQLPSGNYLVAEVGPALANKSAGELHSMALNTAPTIAPGSPAGTGLAAAPHYPGAPVGVRAKKATVKGQEPGRPPALTPKAQRALAEAGMGPSMGVEDPRIASLFSASVVKTMLGLANSAYNDGIPYQKTSKAGSALKKNPHRGFKMLEVIGLPLSEVNGSRRARRNPAAAFPGKSAAEMEALAATKPNAIVVSESGKVWALNKTFNEWQQWEQDDDGNISTATYSVSLPANETYVFVDVPFGALSEMYETAAGAYAAMTETSDASVYEGLSATKKKVVNAIIEGLQRIFANKAQKAKSLGGTSFSQRVNALLRQIWQGDVATRPEDPGIASDSPIAPYLRVLVAARALGMWPNVLDPGNRIVYRGGDSARKFIGNPEGSFRLGTQGADQVLAMHERLGLDFENNPSGVKSAVLAWLECQSAPDGTRFIRKGIGGSWALAKKVAPEDIGAVGNAGTRLSRQRMLLRANSPDTLLDVYRTTGTASARVTPEPIPTNATDYAANIEGFYLDFYPQSFKTFTVVEFSSHPFSYNESQQYFMFRARTSDPRFIFHPGGTTTGKLNNGYESERAILFVAVNDMPLSVDVIRYVVSTGIGAGQTRDYNGRWLGPTNCTPEDSQCLTGIDVAAYHNARPSYPSGPIPEGPAKPLYEVIRNPAVPGRLGYEEMGRRMQEFVLRRNPGHAEGIRECAAALASQQKRRRKSQPMVTFLMGPAGSGKSTWAQERYANESNTVILDSDTFKHMHPSWVPGMTASPSLHEWSVRTQEEVYRRILAQLQPTDHIVFDGTGAWEPALIERINEARAVGAFVEFAVVLVPIEVAMQRVNERVRRGGHGVPEWKIREQAAQVRETFCNVAPLVDRIEVADNSKARQVSERGGLLARSRELAATVVASLQKNPRKRRSR